MIVRRTLAGVCHDSTSPSRGSRHGRAETTSTIEQVEALDGQMSIVLALNDLAPDADVDTENVSATLEGQPLDLVVESASDSSDITQTTLLVMDTSDSMNQDNKLQDAKEAAELFIDAVPAEVELGLLTFDNVADLRVEPTLDRTELLDAVQGLTTAPQTVLYDAVVLAADELQNAGVGSALLLSDGADRGSSATLAQATKAAEQAGARFDVVSFGESTGQIGALTDIAAATDGTVYEAADTAALVDVFDAAASSISNRLVLTADIPEDYTETSGTISVTVFVDDEAVTDQAFVTLNQSELTDPGAVPEPQAAPEPGALATLSSNLIWVAIIGIGIALLVLVYYAITAATDRERSQRSGVRRRLSIYTLGGRQPVKEQETTVLGDTQVARSAVEFAGRVVAQRDFESVLGAKLEAAAVPLKPAEWLLIHVGVTLGGALLLFLISNGRLLLTLIGTRTGRHRPLELPDLPSASKRRKAFMAALPDTLQLMAGSLAAGYSMPQAVDTVVREGKPPISTEFNRALVETRLGVELEDALDGIATRMQSVDFAWVVMAIRIQREVGGNLAEVLTTVAATLRERERLRRQVQVLSAEGRLSAWILGLLAPRVCAVSRSRPTGVP